MTEEMKSYISIKLTQAKPMTLGSYNRVRGWDIPVDEDPTREGYMVEYADGYQTWAPKEAFEDACLELDDPTRITEETIERFIGPGAVYSTQVDEKTTHVSIVPRTGFVQHEFSCCVDPANYDHQIGVAIATRNIRNKLWPMLAFCLQWGRCGLNKTKQ
jgi:hypothetical protein